MSKLAINGGRPIAYNYLSPKKFYDKLKVKNEICKVINSEMLSGFRGSMGKAFWGGVHIRDVEIKFESIMNIESNTVLSVNSCTSALIIACGAIGLQPGDEVIVTPWSMSCSATAPLFYGAVPVFADIEKDYFCLDPKSIEEKITGKTKAIIVVDLFGQPFNYPAIRKIADKYNLFIIEDSAQALGSEWGFNQNYAGTLGDIGCFSFTQGKHFTCGEGGFILTKNEELFEKCALLRNHSDAVISSSNKLTAKYNGSNFIKLPGHNMRMTEIQAAILSIQLDHLEDEVEGRQKIVEELERKINVPGIKFAKVRKSCTHSYYVLAMHYDRDRIEVNRGKFLDAVRAELVTSKDFADRGIGVPIWGGYINPLYNMPIFNYSGFTLPVVEHLQSSELFITLLQGLDLNESEIEIIAEAFNKVYKYKEELL